MYCCFQITDDTKNVFAIDLPLDHLDAPARSMHFHMRMLVQQRDSYYEARVVCKLNLSIAPLVFTLDSIEVLQEIKELSQSGDDLDRANQQLVQLQQQVQQLQSNAPSSAPDKQEKQHLSVELAETKARLRKLRQEL